MPLQLLNLRYQKAGSSKPIVLLLLGMYDNKLYGLDSTVLATADVEFIKAHAAMLAGLDLAKKVSWLRDHRPSLMAAYKGIKAGNCSVVSSSIVG